MGNLLVELFPLLQAAQLRRANATFPAVLVMGRATDDGPLAFADGKVLQDDNALEARLLAFAGLELNGAKPYGYTVAPLADAPRVVERARAELAEATR